MNHSIRHCLKALGQFLIFGNAYIALCAVVMCQTTADLFTLQLPNSFLLFIFAGTLGSYSLHWYLTDTTATSQRSSWNKEHKLTLLVLLMSAVFVGVWQLSHLMRYLVDLLPVIVLTFLYTAPKINWPPFRALRRIAVLKTTYLALVWTYVTVAVPLLIVPPVGGPDGSLISVLLLNRFLFIYSVALCFDYRDRDQDRQSRWLTIVSMLTNKQLRLFSAAIALCFGLSIALLYANGFDLRQVVCLSLPMMLLVLTVGRIVRNESDYSYYIYLDGLLMLPGILLKLLP
ncbi:UbiA prenyltransferase family protein [Spirosoma endbachense]|uniref:UbiA prenyltransferase family protein n=1 Tax=Spirosoma endbachense TaxID=2666025 RepID=A0A6P1VZV7_9BACT|nr:hypothetical protein [Spirosoma endbachense]QHV97612.1 hypothetical protein GJR95_22535 [Spirosoma endbachense]